MRRRPVTDAIPALLRFLGLASACLTVGLVPTGTLQAAVIGELSDPEHPAVEASLDILGASIEQVGGQLTFSIEVRGEIPTPLPQPEDTLVYLWFVDTDENPGTGQFHGPIGSEFNVRAVVGELYGGGFVDVVGAEPGGGTGMVTVEGSFIRLRIGLAQIGSPADFNWSSTSFQILGGEYTHGNPDTELVASVTLPYTAPARVTVTTPLLALSPSGPATGQLAVEIRDAQGNLMPNEEHLLVFHSTNEAVATVDDTGLVKALAVPEYHWEVPYIEVSADGLPAGNSAVVRTTTTDLGVVYQTYPAQHVAFYLTPSIEGVDLNSLTLYFQVAEATELSYVSQASGVGTVPFGGGLQYFVLDVSNDPDTTPCGASGNPVRLGWEWGDPIDNSCYIVNVPAHRVPQWFVIFHELGHNFTLASNSFAFYCMGPSETHNTAYREGVGSLAAMWSWKTILAWPKGLRPTTAADIEEQQGYQTAFFLQRLGEYQSAGAVYDSLEPNVVDGILYEVMEAYGPEVWWDLFSTFLPASDPLPLPVDTKEKQATWFVAAMSASAGEDLRSLFGTEYGFPTDDEAWPDILAAVQAKIAARPYPGIKTRPNLLPVLSLLLQ